MAIGCRKRASGGVSRLKARTQKLGKGRAATRFLLAPVGASRQTEHRVLHVVCGLISSLPLANVGATKIAACKVSRHGHWDAAVHHA